MADRKTRDTRYELGTRYIARVPALTATIARRDTATEECKWQVGQLDSLLHDPAFYLREIGRFLRAERPGGFFSSEQMLNLVRFLVSVKPKHVFDHSTLAFSMKENFVGEYFGCTCLLSREGFLIFALVSKWSGPSAKFIRFIRKLQFIKISLWFPSRCTKFEHCVVRCKPLFKHRNILSREEYNQAMSQLTY